MEWSDPLDDRVRAALAEPVPPGDASLRAVFEAQATSRHLDFAARWLHARGEGFYTIGSAGHESNAFVAAALRPTDPALLHYRSGGFYCARAAQVEGSDPVRDVLLGVVAAADEPIAGGRHKVFGNAALAVIPQTSTIASHLPRAVGVAFAIERARKLGVGCAWPYDAVAVASLGDASVNHSTALGALNAAAWTAHQNLPLPLLVVCEDNGLGISVRTPPGWVRAASERRPGFDYRYADGADPIATRDAALDAVELVRERRRPVFLHLRTVRYLGHAGSDVESAYRTPAELAADLELDPLLATARALGGDDLLAAYDRIGEHVAKVAAEVAGSRRLASAAEVMAPIVVRSAVVATSEVREDRPLTFAQAVNRALADLGERHPELLVFGEDVAAKGGVYGVTRGLRQRLGGARVFDTLLDEQTILGLALGAGVSGLLPVPEIQYLAYLHNAEDQLRGEAATLRFFSQGQYANPLVVRIAGYGYQKGFGGHFHNDDAVGVLRDVPGLVVASPARPDDAAAMLRTCVEAARADGAVCAFLEPIALYHQRDLHDEGDGGWLAPYPSAHVPTGSGRTYGDGGDLTLVSFANGVRMSLRVMRRLEARGIRARLLDLRWLAPLPVDDLLREADATGRVLVVDETRRTGGVSEGVVTALVDAGFGGVVRRVASQDSFVPLGAAANLVLLSEDEIEQAALALL